MGRICDSSSDLAVFANFPSSRRFKIHLRVVSLLSYCVTMEGLGIYEAFFVPRCTGPPTRVSQAARTPGDTLPFPRAPRFLSWADASHSRALFFADRGAVPRPRRLPHVPRTPRFAGLPWSMEAPADAKEKTEAGMGLRHRP